MHLPSRRCREGVRHSAHIPLGRLHGAAGSLFSPETRAGFVANQRPSVGFPTARHGKGTRHGHVLCEPSAPLAELPGGTPRASCKLGVLPLTPDLGDVITHASPVTGNHRGLVPVWAACVLTRRGG